MTECERLIANGTFTRDFFKPEVRCDFFVDEKRKKIWAILLDLLIHLDKVCTQHKLQYFLCAGTLLGAVRHHGFIPWDDDIDVMMPRKDYDMLLKLTEEFPSPYLLQCPTGDNDYGFSFVKLRNVNTTGVSLMFVHEDFNQGIFIDIFPMDNVLLPEAFDVYYRIGRLVRENSLIMRRNNPNLSKDDIKNVSLVSGVSLKRNLELVDELSRSFNKDECEYFGSLVCTMLPLEKKVFSRQAMSSTIRMPFEGISLPVPCGWDIILCTQYGDYMQFPAKEIRGTWHSGSYFNADIPFHKWKQMHLEKGVI